VPGVPGAAWSPGLRGWSGMLAGSCADPASTIVPAMRSVRPLAPLPSQRYTDARAATDRPMEP
jgi:hypothetical protein